MPLMDVGVFSAKSSDWCQEDDGSNGQQQNLTKLEYDETLLALCEGNPLVTGGLLIYTKGTVMFFFLWCHPKLAAKWTVELLVISDATMLISMG